jgi:hypothetical protein
MMHLFTSTVNFLSNPTIFFTLSCLGYYWLMKNPEKWTQPKVMKWVLLGSFAFLGISLIDPNFRKEALKPDNVPIWILTYSAGALFWLAIYKAVKNDQLAAAGQPIYEKTESDKKVYTWPDLVYSELICMVLFLAFLIVWSIVLKSPLEDPANSGVTPAVAKAPWYFLGLQEILVYYDPWMAGVVLPGMIVVGLIAMPYFDRNPLGNGYYTYKDRKLAIWLFGFGFFILWVALIFLGTFMRGPGWNFFGPFEEWDSHKIVALSNINLSEIIWVKMLGTGLPKAWYIREFAGIILILVYILVLPPVLAATVLKGWYEKMGFVRYNLVVNLLLLMFSLPLKMYLRWGFNLKYIFSFPDIGLNI